MSKLRRHDLIRHPLNCAIPILRYKASDQLLVVFTKTNEALKCQIYNYQFRINRNVLLNKYASEASLE